MALPNLFIYFKFILKNITYFLINAVGYILRLKLLKFISTLNI